MENFTSLDVSGSPLWNLTFGRSLNSQVVSPVSFHSVASWGTRLRSGSRVVRLSKIWNDTVMLLIDVLMCGSKSVTSADVATSTSRLLAGALAVATPLWFTCAAGAGPAAAVGCAAAGLLSAGFAALLSAG